MRVVLSEHALRDLEEIGDYIAADSPRRAASFVRDLRSSCAALASMPARFPVVGERRGRLVRRRVHGSHLVFYSEAPERVDVLRILHGARDYMRILFADEGD